ncbi:putative hemolysin [Candidatus Sulfotelmatobacter kueseliae]|uniref:Putative hemolysin n=1 Tax=Candidatus Sulfotelmatobacter kueseliae TaxID=2042962 RepID=A0A2U3K3W8_9BACT|nr:putative hemolysin [Candidatus Sulfotelmatobacter kueseliae]
MPKLPIAGDEERGVLTEPPLLPGLPEFAGKFIPTEQARELYQRVRSAPHGFRLEALLAEMKIRLEVPLADIDRIPIKGPLVAVANHPFGVLDGVALAVLLLRVRPDVKILTNALLEGIPELHEHCIFVDPFQTASSTNKNLRPLKQAMAWLRQGGALAVFPAGEVSQWNVRQAQVTDPAWNTVAARLVRKSGASALPVYFCGRNSVAFQVLGLINPRLRTLFLLQEFLQQREKDVQVRIGGAIPSELIANLDSDEEATEYLRLRTYLLSYRGKKHISLPTKMRSAFPRKAQEPIAAEVPARFVMDDIAALPAERLLVENAEFAVYAARASELPHALDELGRLREITFRAAGEGTGRRVDLDRFDAYYWHLLLWDKEKRELAGAYRAGNTDEIIRAHGVKGLYTNTCFRYDEQLFLKIGSALELGRSFVRSEYQRQYAPLLLLWKGIARFVAAHPQTPVLFGAVSISNEYCSLSREMIVHYFEQRGVEDEDGREFAHLIHARTPFRAPNLRRWDCGAICSALRDLDELAEPISDVEEDGKGLPILLKQYAKVGGRLVGFNLDRKFSDVVDGLVIVDLRQTEPSVLERYMGKEGFASFRHFHKLG